jgi:RNA polymerase sigma factor (sigma-70 family)
MVWGVCRHLLGNPPDAEDAFQATFLVLACKATSIGRGELLAGWLFGVARREALRVRTARTRRACKERSCGELPDRPAKHDQTWNDAGAVLAQELARLPAKYRLPLLLCGLEGLTHAEAGKSLGWPTGTVAGRLSRARVLLRTRLLRRGIAAPAAALTVLAAVAVPPRLAAAARDAPAAAGPSAGHPPARAGLMRAGLGRATLSRWLATSALVAALAMALGAAATVGHLTRRAGGPVGDSVATVYAGRALPAIPREPAVRLPSDPNAVVIRMERFVDSDAEPAMALTIYADGRVVARLPDGLPSPVPTELTTHAARGRAPGSEAHKTEVLRGRLRARELVDLLRFVIHDQEFFDLEAAAIKADIWRRYHRDGKVSDPTDATTTGYRIRTAGRTHDVRWSRLAKSAWDFPEVKRLFQLYAVDRRLQQVVYVLLAGGPERIEAVAKKMNELAQPSYRLYPAAPRLTAADLFRVTRSVGASRTQFTFSRNKEGTVRTPLFEIAIDVPEEGEPTLFYVMPPKS